MLQLAVTDGRILINSYPLKFGWKDAKTGSLDIGTMVPFLISNAVNIEHHPGELLPVVAVDSDYIIVHHWSGEITKTGLRYPWKFIPFQISKRC
jgi:hypothetical protein